MKAVMIKMSRPVPNPRERKRLGENAHRLAEEVYSQESVSRKLDGVLNVASSEGVRESLANSW